MPITLFLSKKEREERKNICDKCSNKNNNKCSVCGCYLIALQKVKLWECPIGKF